MCSYVARPYEGGADLVSLVELAQRITGASLPRPSYYHAGDFVWQLYALDRSDDVRIWRADDPHAEVVACAIFESPLTFQFEIDPSVPDQAEIMTEIMRWAEERRSLVADKRDIPLAYQRFGADAIMTSALESDSARIACLMENGFAEHETLSLRLARGLDDALQAVPLPEGARFRRVADADAEERAELHRDAWSVWGESKHSVEIYRRLRAAPLYDADLDIVLERDGQMVSYCVCWLDNVNRIGLFEPVGTRPSAARRGFGRAVIHEGFRRLRAKGMRTAIVSSGDVNPPAMALYASAGFAVAEREHFYVKQDVT